MQGEASTRLAFTDYFRVELACAGQLREQPLDRLVAANPRDSFLACQS